MGWAERSNPNSMWNKTRAGKAVHPASTNVASPISNTSNQAVQVPTPINRDEPVVIELNPKSAWALFKEFLCRRLNIRQVPQSPAPQS